MCSNKQLSVQRMGPLNIKLAKITIVVIFCCFAECAAGSCLSYGHACWGAHGKRSGSDSSGGSVPSQELAADLLPNPRWFLARLIKSPLEARYENRDRNNEVAARQQLFLDASQLDADFKGPEEYRNFQDAIAEAEEGAMFDEVMARQHPHPRKLRSVKLEKKNPIKMI